MSDNIINLPEIVSRNTFYYSTDMFKKALYLQTGFGIKYFSKFYMNGYDPLLSELYVQNEKEIGEFPIIDFFINAKIQQTRLYFKFEHFNSSAEPEPRRRSACRRKSPGRRSRLRCRRVRAPSVPRDPTARARRPMRSPGSSA